MSYLNHNDRDAKIENDHHVPWRPPFGTLAACLCHNLALSDMVRGCRGFKRRGNRDALLEDVLGMRKVQQL
jgi:hypothetical protein